MQGLTQSGFSSNEHQKIACMLKLSISKAIYVITNLTLKPYALILLLIFINSS